MDDMPYVDHKGCVYKYGEFYPIELSSLHTMKLWQWITFH